MTVYFDIWSDHSEMVAAFVVGDGLCAVPVPDDMAKPEEVLFASYASIDYGGEAIVLFERGGELYEVRGYHCSCYGLEGQWEPMRVTWPALALRLPDMDEDESWCFMHDHTNEAQEAFKALVMQHTGGQP